MRRKQGSHGFIGEIFGPFQGSFLSPALGGARPLQRDEAKVGSIIGTPVMVAIVKILPA
jgi:hypothetical protein